ncbi:MAG TPA: N-acetylmuramoyl-L-alanine amidase [Pseudogracilibacillus sp.]|nr:N-acetylmuramoyl-L-alanine amidase [Pseudogracilibacillus sp.]
MVKIYIDPGHGGSDPGSQAYGLQEKNVTLDIAKRIRSYLNKNYTGHTIKMSRTTDKTVSLSARTKEANRWGADFFLSVHINAGGGTGYEDYIHSSLSNTSQTAKYRTIIHDKIIKETKVRDRGKKKANFAVLRTSAMSAVLTENMFIDTKADANKLKSSVFLNKLAKAHADGIAKAFKLKKKTSSKPPTKPGKETFYRVVAGSYKNRKNAEAQMAKLKAAGVKGVFIDVYKE